MHWLLQTNLYSEEGWEALVGSLERLELPYSIHKVIPFGGGLEPHPQPLESKVIVMGSYTLAKYAKAQGWSPGSYLDNLDFEVQYERWGSRMLNHDAFVCRFEDVPEQLHPFFVRPVHDTKSFTGYVTDWIEFGAWRERVLSLSPEDHPTITADTQVMVCSKKQIFDETRCWVVDGRVVTQSGYKVGTIKRYTHPFDVDQDIVEFAESCVDIWQPNKAFVLDVARTPEGHRICEINNLNSAGFYKADVNKLIQALEAMELKTSWKLS